MHKSWILIPIVLFLMACATSENKLVIESFKEKELLDGIWQGSFDIRGRGPYDFYVIHVGGRSTAVSHKAKAICSGDVTLDGEHYTAKYHLYALDGAPFDQATITGILSDGTIDSHFVTMNGGDTGSLTISYSSIYEQISSLELVAGEWTFTDRDNLVTNFSIDLQGVVSGKDSDQCEYQGKINLINPKYNAYDVTLNIMNCDSVSGEYKGLGYIDNQESELFRIDVTNELYGFHYDLQKVIIKAGL